MDGVRILIVSILILSVGQVQAATLRTFDPKGVSILSVTEAVNNSTSQGSVIVPVHTEKDIAQKEAEACKRKAFKVDPQSAQWAQMLQVNDHSVFLKFKF